MCKTDYHYFLIPVDVESGKTSESISAPGGSSSVLPLGVQGDNPSA